MAFPDDQLTTYRAERYDGCEMFTHTAFCTELADRRADLLEIVPK